ncbi:hypothetical protein BB561_000188 [Smittium simulii]|uniref:Uncharacterized protein n=1 Tax=Smittium simulii TaxID=133385 RepID=A0A2T9Z023_9FUNG|nr:hypothetical protein BB561_000188 [Smittium simulii]
MIILERPIASIYGNGANTGLSIDISYETTNIVPIIDSQVQNNFGRTINIGGAQIAKYLSSLIKERDIELYNDIQKVGNINDFSTYAVESGACGFNIIENETLSNPNNIKKDTYEIEFKGVKFNLGDERFMCCKLFFDEELTGSTNSFRFLDAIAASVACNEPEKRPNLWESIHLVGKFSNLIKNYLKNHVLGKSEHFSEFQSRDCKVMKIPEYFYGWQNSHNMATFLGAIIIAKIALNDPKYHITKIDYNELGPSAFSTKSFT